MLPNFHYLYMQNLIELEENQKSGATLPFIMKVPNTGQEGKTTK